MSLNESKTRYFKYTSLGILLSISLIILVSGVLLESSGNCGIAYIQINIASSKYSSFNTTNVRLNWCSDENSMISTDRIHQKSLEIGNWYLDLGLMLYPKSDQQKFQFPFWISTKPLFPMC